MLCWSVVAGHITETNAEAIPGVDGRNRESQIGQFGICKMRTHLLIYFVGHMIDGQQGEFFGPEQGGSLAFRKKGRLVPDWQSIKTLLRLASHRTFASLRLHRNYRLFFFGQLTSVAGTWMYSNR